VPRAGEGLKTMRKSIVLAAALLAATVPAHAQVAAPAAAQTAPNPAQVFARLSDAEIKARVEAAIAQVTARPEAVGLSVAVARGDKIIVERGAGFADLATRRRAGAVTEFRIGSVTKQFTAAAIMKLVEQGKIRLDDPLAKYLPDFDTGGRTVTIRQLLNHASGIPNYTAQPGFGAIAAKPDLTAQDVLKLVSGAPFDFEPGTGWRYSNTNYYLLGLIIEKVTGQPYGDFVQNRLFKPLGLTRTRYDSGDASVADRALGYAFDPATNARPLADPLSMTGPFSAGAIASTAGDLLRWQIALTGGRAVSAASFQQMSGSTVKIGQGDAAYGFGLMVDRIGGMRRIWHNGGINGFNSVLTWWPDLGLRTAVISNSEGLPSEAVEQMIVAALTSDKPLPPARTSPQPGSEAALRTQILGMASGAPDYAAMTPQMAEVVRGQVAALKPLFQELGPLKALIFTSVDLNGVDQYLAQFANGALLFSIALDSQGKIGGSWFRPVAKP
jgi:CubicO group peptidase (beta-lactamase class C family)